MSYYILTLASNLGNILSTESISPVSLYAERNYGFRFFDISDDNENANLLRLYRELPVVANDEDEEAGIAMVLELDESVVKHSNCSSDGLLWTAETIHITPTKCRFIFYTTGDLRTAFNGVRKSVEAKFVAKYQARATVMTLEGSSDTLFDMSRQHNSANSDVQPEDIARYERLDRMKGAIFGYCLGFYYSLPKDPAVRGDFVEYLETVDDMVNSVTQTDAAGLESYRRSLEYVLYRFAINAMARQTKPIKQLKKSENQSFNIENELVGLRELASVELPRGLQNDSFMLNMYRADLEERIHRAKDAWKKPTPFRDANKPTIVDGESGPLLHLPEKDGEIADHLINYLIRSDVLGRTRRSLGYEFALDCGKLIRSRVGDRWEGSGEREYVNKLLPHLNNMEEFDPDENPGIDDRHSFEVLRMLALLCERQDNSELDSFYRYLLIKCQVADFCLPFALWGAAFGFSAMPKTLCDSMSKTTEDTARNLFDEVLAILEK